MEVANYWRTTPDISDNWKSIYTRAFNHYRWSPFQRPGNWNDPDMLVFGHVGWGKNMRDSRLLPQEQLTHMSLWSLFASPLLLGCDLTKLNEYTESLLTNPEVIALNQDPRGLPARRILREKQGEHVFVRPLADGSTAVALVNTEAGDLSIKIDLETLGVETPVQVRNVWERNDLGVEKHSVGGDIPPHGTLLLRLTRQ
jgi:alpha-galactosidase